MELYKLPAGVKIPNKYKRTLKARQFFIEGAQDAEAGRVGYDNPEDLIRRQGAAAWEAYQEGRQAWARLQDSGNK